MPIDKNKFKDMAYWLELKFKKIQYHNKDIEYQIWLTEYQKYEENIYRQPILTKLDKFISQWIQETQISIDHFYVIILF